MIVPSGAVRVLVATRPVDFRKGMDGLAALVRESLGSDPYSGVIYVFRAKRADRVKLLLWDGTGLVLVAKRLEKSSFRWPRISRRRDASDIKRIAISPQSGCLLKCRTRGPPGNRHRPQERRSRVDDHARLGGALQFCCLCKMAAAPNTVNDPGPPLYSARPVRCRS